MKHAGRFIEEEKKKKSKKPLIIIIIVILVIAAAGAVLYFNWGNWFGNNPAQNTNSDFVIDPNAGDGSVPTEAPQKAESIQIPGYPSITIAANTPNVKMALLNPEGNPCYFKFEIVLKDTDETIYESQFVPPGKTITDVTLTRGLSEGEHPATIKISTVALDKETPLNGANVETVLIAK